MDQLLQALQAAENQHWLIIMCFFVCLFLLLNLKLCLQCNSLTFLFVECLNKINIIFGAVLIFLKMALLPL